MPRTDDPWRTSSRRPSSSSRAGVDEPTALADSAQKRGKATNRGGGNSPSLRPSRRRAAARCGEATASPRSNYPSNLGTLSRARSRLSGLGLVRDAQPRGGDYLRTFDGVSYHHFERTASGLAEHEHVVVLIFRRVPGGGLLGDSADGIACPAAPSIFTHLAPQTAVIPCLTFGGEMVYETTHNDATQRNVRRRRDRHDADTVVVGSYYGGDRASTCHVCAHPASDAFQAHFQHACLRVQRRVLVLLRWANWRWGSPSTSSISLGGRPG